jgi:hypothetical protein
LGQYAVWTQFFGGIALNGYDVIDDSGFGTQIHGATIFGGDDASIECEPKAIGEGIYGGNNFDIINETATSLSAYGVKLDTTGGANPTFCSNAHIGGNWIGQISNIYNLTPANAGNTIEGISEGSPGPLVVSGIGSQALLASSYPGLYAATGGMVATLEAKTNIAMSKTYTFDTAANIIASLTSAMGGGVTGVQFRIRFNSHSTNGVALAVGSNVTLIGNCSIPGVAAVGGGAYRDAVGTVTGANSVAIQCLGP